MDKKIRYGIIGFGAQGSSYVNILTGTPAFPGREGLSHNLDSQRVIK